MKQLLTLFAALTLVAGYAQKTSGYSISKTFRIASSGGWDYPAVNEASNKLYLSHASQVNIVDKTTGDSIGVIPNTNGVHGIAFVNELGKGYTSNGRSNSVTVFDLKTDKILGQIEVGKNPDWIMFDPFSKKIITSNHSGGDLSVIDPVSDKLVGTIAVGGGKLETVVSDEKGKLFVNVEDKNEIAVVDMVKMATIAHWPIAPGDGPTGLVIDKKNNRIFATCEKLLIAVDASNGKILSQIPIGEGCDGAAFDPTTGLIFTANGEGTVTVIKVVNANSFIVVENIKTKKSARTITIDTKTHQLYLPAADLEPADAAKGGRPKMLPGTFQVLVLSK